MRKQTIWIKITHNPPTAKVWNGACKMLIRLNDGYFSSFSIITGNTSIPGAAIKIRDNTTCEMPLTAANRLLPISFPFSSWTLTPSINSFCRINGMLTQLAAATAANGTYLCSKMNRIKNWQKLSKKWIVCYYELIRHLSEWTGMLLQESLETDSHSQGAASCWNVRNAQLIHS